MRVHVCKFALTLAVLSTLISLAHAEDFSGKVVGVLDRDTIEVMHLGKAERIRLNGIDCPEKDQAFGQRAKQFISDLAFGKMVVVRIIDHDRYGRTIGEVILPDGRNLNRELVKAGLAWWYRQYSTDETLGALEAEARAAKRGLEGNKVRGRREIRGNNVGSETSYYVALEPTSPNMT